MARGERRAQRPRRSPRSADWGRARGAFGRAGASRVSLDGPEEAHGRELHGEPELVVVAVPAVDEPAVGGIQVEVGTRLTIAVESPNQLAFGLSFAGRRVPRATCRQTLASNSATRSSSTRRATTVFGGPVASPS